MSSEYKILNCRNRTIKFGTMPLLMGVVNVTPDSFSDGGKFLVSHDAVARALTLLEDGATIIDVGGESTRPGAIPVSIDEEIARTKPVIEKLKKAAPDCLISIDTRNAGTAEEAMKAGADIINDISGLGYDDEIASVAAAWNAGLILMHMRGVPSNMQSPENLRYQDVIAEVKDFLVNAVEKALAKGVKRDNIVIDPGIGLFSKDINSNHRLLFEIEKLKELGLPMLVGPCRKKFIGEVLNIDAPEERLFGTIGVAVHLAEAEVEILRLHEIKPFREALTMFLWCKHYSGENK